MIGHPREGRDASNHWNQGGIIYSSDTTSISPIMARPASAIDTSTATIDRVFMVIPLPCKGM
jgi:hypothetical protein